MFDIFCNVITNNIKNPYNFENDLLEQAKLMESIRISSHEKKTSTPFRDQMISLFWQTKTRKLNYQFFVLYEAVFRRIFNNLK